MEYNTGMFFDVDDYIKGFVKGNLGINLEENDRLVLQEKFSDKVANDLIKTLHLDMLSKLFDIEQKYLKIQKWKDWTNKSLETILYLDPSLCIPKKSFCFVGRLR